MIVKVSNKKVLIDKKHLKLIQSYSWHVETGHGYVVRRNSKKNKFYFHREIMGNPKNKVVDHVNHNKLDNRTANLKIVSHWKNTLNRSTKQVNNTSGYLGVSRTRNGKKWRAYISHNGKQIHLGQFDLKKEAADVVDSVREQIMLFPV